MRVWDASFGRPEPTLCLPPWVPKEDETTDALIRTILNATERAVLVDVNNVAEWSLGRAGYVLDGDGLTPPWPRCWLEWSAHEEGDHGLRAGEAMGLWVETEPRDSEEVTQYPLPESVAWQVTVIGPFWMTDGQVRGPMAHMALNLDDQGRQVGELGMYPLHWLNEMMPGDEAWRRFFRWFRSQAAVAMSAFQFANCRNVEAVEVLPSRQQRRHAERKGEPINSHYVLRIDDATQRKVYARDGEPIPSNKRLHICRGHFATYSEDRPLFGKYAGRFWIPAHVRGTDRHGTVSKDYAIGSAA